MLQAAACEVTLVDENHVTPAGNSAITIIHAVDRRVVLIVASDRRKRESVAIPNVGILVYAGIDQEIGLFRRCSPLALRCRNIEPKSTGLLDAGIEVSEVWKHRLDAIADLAIIGNQIRPINPGVLQRGQRHAGDDGRL